MLISHPKAALDLYLLNSKRFLSFRIFVLHFDRLVMEIRIFILRGNKEQYGIDRQSFDKRDNHTHLIKRVQV